MAKVKSFRDVIAPKERVKEKEPYRLDRAAFNRATLQVARDLLGKFIVRSYRGRNISGMITEVEAYKGPKDAASHARGGRRTARVEPLYADGGTVYVYFIYGIHWMLNFSTAGKDMPEGVLIRGILADTDGEGKLLAGPGRVTKYLKIDKKLDGADVTDSTQIWLEDRGVRIPARSIKRGPRIGVDFAGLYWAAKPWRFWIERSTAALVTNRLLK